MKIRKVTSSVLLCLGLGLATANAQEAAVASGGNASGSGGSVSYSVGQIVYTTNSGSSGTVAQGVQQAYEISIVTSIDEKDALKLNLLAYPNPTSDVLVLQISDFDSENLSYQLTDVNGKLIERKKITSKTESINVLHLATAVYFLKVTQDNSEIETFKIVKN